LLSAPPNATLAYADLPARWGVSVERTAQSLRLVIPPVPHVKDLPRAYLIGTALLAAFVTFFAVIALTRSSPALDDRALVSTVVYGSVLLLLIWHGWTRLSRRVALEVSASVLSIAHLARGGRVVSRTSWPRHQVGGAKYNPSSRKLTIRIIGINLVDVYVSPNRIVTEWVARVLDDALREIPVSTASAQVHCAASDAPVRVADRCRHGGMHHPHPGCARRRAAG
jgi:hypothetical protein